VQADGLADLQRLVGGDIESLPYPGRDDVCPFFDEEGKLKALPLNRRASMLLAESLGSDWIAGDCVLTGFDPVTGENRPLPDDVLAAERSDGWQIA
jgi:hypothetical protein